MTVRTDCSLLHPLHRGEACTDSLRAGAEYSRLDSNQGMTRVQSPPRLAAELREFGSVPSLVRVDEHSTLASSCGFLTRLSRGTNPTVHGDADEGRCLVEEQSR